MASSALRRAKKVKRDEFYTQLEDIEKELDNYREYFEGKVIYLNCDDPRWSNFWKYFTSNFDLFGLKKLIATYYVGGGGSSYKYEYERQDGTREPKVVKTKLKGNGDFRSEECVELLKEADLVITNPPFSLWREYLAQLIEYDKKFIIIGNQNAFTYKEVFPLLKDNAIWTGYKSGGMAFRIPAHYPEKSNTYIGEDGYKYQKLGNICWFTNLEIDKRHEEMVLTEFYEGNEENYPKYDNYEAIEVSKLKEIPMDYDGAMGVPITYLGKHSPDQFEILGVATGRKEFEDPKSWPSKRYANPIQHNKDGSTTTNASKVNTGATILLDEAPAGAIYYTADNADGPLKIAYARILIVNKKPKVQK